MLTKNDYVNLFLIVKAAKVEGLEQAQLVVGLAGKLQAHVQDLQKEEDNAKVAELVASKSGSADFAEATKKDEG